MNIVLFGAPGVGKGTQAALLSERLDLPHISTGAIFRSAAASGSALGLELKATMEKGLLVPDELTTRIALEALEADECSGGFILDGFPRNRAQAEALDAALAGRGHRVDHVIYLTAPLDELVERMLKRGRTDDTRETITKRFEVYQDETAPVLDFYREKGMVLELNGVGEIEDVNNNIVALLEAVGKTEE